MQQWARSVILHRMCPLLWEAAPFLGAPSAHGQQSLASCVGDKKDDWLVLTMGDRLTLGKHMW